MTNEELKNMLFIIDTLLDDAITDSTRQKVKDTLTEVCKLAIKALEQQSTGTKTYLKRREDNYVEYNVEWFLKNWELELEILSGGKVKPTDAVSREAINTLIDELARAISDERIGISRGRSTATIMRDILHLPSVTPQRPKGKWINDNCSICGYGVRPWNNTPYCPNCGAEMSRGGEDEADN